MSDSEDDAPSLSAETMAALQQFYKEKEEQQNQFQQAVESGDASNVSIGEDWLRISDSDDDAPSLSLETIAALQQFDKEKEEQQTQFEQAVESGDASNVSIGDDWQLSQFWYSDETATKLATEALNIAGDNGSIACISAPTAYKKIRELKPNTCTAKCLEYDERFQVYGEDFLFYDYKEPLNVPMDLKQSFSVVIADPPFLNEECLCKTSVTAKFLAKDKIILCTGQVMESAALKLLGAKPCTFIPTHASPLQNEFRCYTNYDSDLLNS